MSGPVSCVVTFPPWLKRIQAAESRIALFIAAQMQTNRGMLFAQEGAYNGRSKWAPLKYRSGQILSKTGALKNSLAPRGAPGTAGPGGAVEVSGPLTRKSVSLITRLAYARMMDKGTTGLPGGVLKPKKASVLRFPVANGFAYAKEVKIPARSFTDWNAQDKKELKGALTGLVTRILNGG